MPATDVHQHLWPEPLLRLLAARADAPRLRRVGDGWELELSGEAAGCSTSRAHDPAARTALAGRDGLERVLVAPSSPLGIESLPAAEAQPLLDAFHQGVHEVGGPFAPWGSIPLAAPEPAAVDALLDAGAPGLCLPASALAGERRSTVPGRCWSGSRPAARRCSCTRVPRRRPTRRRRRGGPR